MKFRTIVYIAAGALAAHMALYGFTGIALWGEWEFMGGAQRVCLIGLHGLAFMAAFVLGIGHSVELECEQYERAREKRKEQALRDGKVFVDQPRSN